MIKINLLPVRAAKKKESFMNQVYVGILVLALALAGVGFRAYSQQDKIAKKEKEIGNAKADLAKYQEIAKTVAEFEAKKEVLEQKIGLIVSLETGREGFIQTIDQISQSIPGNVWVITLNTKGKGKGAAAAVNLKGGAYEKDAIGIFVSNLNARKDYIAGATLGPISGTDKKGVSRFTFEINVIPKVNKPPEAEGEAAPEKSKRGRKK